jgi:ribosomal protein S18 acetylase RimI-like enzyme
MEIRVANKAESDTCVELDRIVMGTDKRKDFLRRRIEHRRMYVAVIEGRVVGFITFETNFVGCLYISLLLVHPDFRRRGIARKLVEMVASHSRDGRLFSSTEEDNEVSIKMHEALGFRTSGYIENLPQPQREIIYYKYLK